MIADPPIGKRYGTVLADPPWPELGGVRPWSKRRDTAASARWPRGAQTHYACMSVKDIAMLGRWVQSRALSDAHLYLWTTNNYLPTAINQVLPAWGFAYITLITWLKEGRPGIGQYFRGQTEHVIFARRGQPAYRTLPNGKRAQGRTGFSAPRPGGHSTKPDQIHEWAELVSPGPYLEMFARRARPGWDVWGLEAPDAEDGAGNGLLASLT